MADDVPTAGSAVPGPETNPAVHRIGTTERQSAVDALSQHTRDGRLTAQEYEERSEAVKRSLTWADLDQLFVDLPAPHPAPGTGAVTSAPAAPPASGRPATTLAGQSAADVPVRTHPGLIPENVGIWLVSLSPFIALALFFLTDQWLFFLLIPVAGLLVYGPNGHHDHPRDRKRNRRT